MLKAQGKVRVFTLDLAKVMFINCQKYFAENFQLIKNCQFVISKLDEVSKTEDNGIMMNDLNDIENHLRDILSVVFQTVFRKSLPTKLSYFSGVSLQINQGSSVDYECIAFRKILLLMICIANSFAYLKSQDQSLLVIFNNLHGITLSSDPKDKTDRYGNAYLAKVATLLFLLNKENSDEIKQQVFSILRIVI